MKNDKMTNDRISVILTGSGEFFNKKFHHNSKTLMSVCNGVVGKVHISNSWEAWTITGQNRSGESITFEYDRTSTMIRLEIKSSRNSLRNTSNMVGLVLDILSRDEKGVLKFSIYIDILFAQGRRFPVSQPKLSVSMRFANVTIR